MAVGTLTGASGRVVVVSNSGIQIFNKSGTALTAQVAAATFFGSGSGTTDPKVIFDRQSGRFFAICQDGNTVANSNLYVAVSTTGTPNNTTTDWSKGSASVITTLTNGGAGPNITAWFDYAGLGTDASRVVVTGNLFTSAGASAGSKIRVFNKASLIAGDFTSSFTDIDNDNRVTSGGGTGGYFTIQPAHVAGTRGDGTFQSDNGNFYLINRFGSTAFRFWELSGTPPSAVSVVQNSLRTWSAGAVVTAGAPQSGTSITLDTLSARVQNAVYRFGIVTACLSSDVVTGDSNATEIYWVKVRSNGGSPTAPTVQQQGSIDPTGSGDWAFMPACGVNSQGETCIVYSESGSAKFPEVRYATRLATDTDGTFQSPVTAKTSAGFYDDFGTTNPERWGDYAACVEDPTDSSFWCAQEYVKTGTTAAGNNGRWGTWIFQTQATTAADIVELARTDDRIYWRAGIEDRNLGFNVYREYHGERQKLNSSLIAGSALRSAGRSEGGGWYSVAAQTTDDEPIWIEAVDLSGASSWKGPMTYGARVPNGSSRPSLSLEGMAAPPELAGQSSASSAFVPRTAVPIRTPARMNGQRVLAARDGWKLTVDHEGWYDLPLQDLVSAGLDARTDPRALRLFAEGEEQACLVLGEHDGRIDPADRIQFYGLGLDTPQTDRRVYWLAVGPGRGKRIGRARVSRPVRLSGGFPSVTERRDRTIYFPAARQASPDLFFGPPVTPAGVELQIDTPHRIPGSGNMALEVLVQGVTDLPDSGPDHEIEVLWDRLEVGSIRFDGIEASGAAFSIPESAATGVSHSVSLRSRGGARDISLVRSLRVAYSRGYHAESDRLRSVAYGGAGVTISGFTDSELRVFDVTDAGRPVELPATVSAQGSAYSASVVVPGPPGSRHVLFAVAAGAFDAPAQIERNEPSSLLTSNNRPRLLIVGPRNLATAYEPLVRQRGQQGVTARYVPVEDIFDEASFGEEDPAAIRDLLRAWRGVGNNGTRFLLLAADSSLDPRGFLGLPPSNLVPAAYVRTRQIWTASDDWFGDLSGSGFSDVAVGRIPARTPAEAERLVAKVVGQDSIRPRQGALLVSDFDEGFPFSAQSLWLGALGSSGLPLVRLAAGDAPASTIRGTLQSHWNRGPGLVSYAGHGSVTDWRNLLSSTEAGRLTNGGNLPLVTAFNCLNGYFVDPALDCLAEALLRNPSGGASAVWASSAATKPEHQVTLSREFYRVLLGGEAARLAPRMTVGEAALRAKSLTPDPDVRYTWNLMGDPSMPMSF